MVLKTIYHYQKDDIEFDGDYSAIEVLFDGELEIIIGYLDGRHSRGQDIIDGIQTCLNALEIDYTYEREDIADAEW